MAHEREMQTYQRELPQLLEHEGKFVLIKDDDVISIWDTQADAVQAGDERFGLESFMVKQILQFEQPRVIPWFLPRCPS